MKHLCSETRKLDFRNVLKTGITAFTFGLVLSVIWLLVQAPSKPNIERTIVYARNPSPTLTLREVRIKKNVLEKEMEKIVQKVRTFGDNELADNAEKCVVSLRTAFTPAVMQVTGIRQMMMLEREPCPVGDKCATFGMMDSLLPGNALAAAMWHSGVMIMTVDPVINPEDGLVPYFIFHEFVHVTQELRGDAMPPNDYEAKADAIISWETEAVRFEITLMNAATGGKYEKLIRSLADSMLAGRVPFIRPRRVYFAPIPREIDRLFVNSQKIEALSLSALHATSMFAVNMVIALRKEDSKERALELEQLYANMAVEYHDHRVQEQERNSVQSW